MHGTQWLCNSLELVGGASMPTNGCKHESTDEQAGSDIKKWLKRHGNEAS